MWTVPKVTDKNAFLRRTHCRDNFRESEHLLFDSLIIIGCFRGWGQVSKIEENTEFINLIFEPRPE